MVLANFLVFDDNCKTLAINVQRYAVEKKQHKKACALSFFHKQKTLEAQQTRLELHMGAF